MDCDDPAAVQKVQGQGLTVANVIYLPGVTKYDETGKRVALIESLGKGGYAEVIKVVARDGMGFGYNPAFLALKKQSFSMRMRQKGYVISPGSVDYCLCKMWLREIDIMYSMGRLWQNCEDDYTKQLLHRTTIRTGMLSILETTPAASSGAPEQAERKVKMFFPMEVMDKRDLEDLKRRQHPFTQEQIFFIIHEFLTGLVFLHVRDIMHRDLSLNNILVNMNDQSIVTRVLISDYGQARNSGGSMDLATESLAYSVNNPLSNATEIAKVHYRPPEGIYGHQYYNKSWDIWQAGIVILAMVGIYEHPYIGESLLDQPTMDTLSGAEIQSKINSQDKKMAKHKQFRTISNLVTSNLGPPSRREMEGLILFRDERQPENPSDAIRRKSYLEATYIGIHDQYHKSHKDTSWDQLQGLDLINKRHSHLLAMLARQNEKARVDPRCTGTIFQQLADAMVRLVTRMISYDPRQRYPAYQALHHLEQTTWLEAFNNQPAPSYFIGDQRLNAAGGYLAAHPWRSTDGRTQFPEDLYQMTTELYGFGSVIKVLNVKRAEGETLDYKLLEATICISIRIFKELLTKEMMSVDTPEQIKKFKLECSSIFKSEYRDMEPAEFESIFGIPGRFIPKLLHFAVCMNDPASPKHYVRAQTALSNPSRGYHSIAFQVFRTVNNIDTSMYAVVAMTERS